MQCVWELGIKLRASNLHSRCFFTCGSIPAYLFTSNQPSLPTATGSLTTGLLLSLLLLLVLVLLGASYWHRARLRQRLCQLKGPSCQYR